MNVADFIAKWRKAELTERSAAQQHFLDLCELVGHPKPADLDPTGDSFTFERGAAKEDGGDGWADVWKRGFFADEYKGKHKDLDAAYKQLLQYREALETPPLLVTCDMGLIVIRTQFTATPTRRIEIKLDDMGKPENIESLRSMFFDPQKLKPGITSETITTQAASHLAEIAQALRTRGVDPHQAALFLDRIVFCLFAEDIDLLPKGLFSDILAKTRKEPARFSKLVGQLFEAMAHGGDFGAAVIRHFNGNLFSDTSVIELTTDELDTIFTTSSLDWSAVDPSIFGTLFVRGMDPAKRSQLGAEYTSRADIETIVEPVVMQPLRRDWNTLKETVGLLLTTGEKDPAKAAGRRQAKQLSSQKLKKAQLEVEGMVHNFLVKLSHVKVLDAACGSGNFLYVTLQKLKDLEKEVILFAMENGLGGFLPQVGPWQLYGIEIDQYAFDLAQMTVWIGYLQWTKANGFGITQEPVLRPMKDNFRLMDAILDLSDPAKPQEPEWPDVDYIVGNPPFLGGKILRKQLGDEYVDKMFKVWSDRVPREADLCCYWFEKARQHIKDGRCRRAGLLATQGIRGGANREVLRRIKETGSIFFAESDRPWILDGANVHVSMAGFDNGDEKGRTLDGKVVPTINANLTSAADVAEAPVLDCNGRIGFMGTTKQGAFDIANVVALEWLSAPNPHGLPNSDVIVPWINGMDVTRRPRDMWIVDFIQMPEENAASYEAPYKHALEKVKTVRDAKARSWYRAQWWQLYASRPEMRSAINGLKRFIVTANVSKHRLFAWQQSPTNPDHQLIVFARDDDYFFGVLHSRVHEVWAMAQGTQLREKESGFRYTPTTCFETFPFPFTPGKEPTSDPHVKAIADAAKELDGLRTNWLNPPEWTREEALEFPGTVGGPWTRYILPGSEKKGIGTVRYPRIVTKDADCAKKLAKRTLTNLYNERPTWLDMAHKKLDEAVCAAYGWPADMTDEQILERLLALNRVRS